MRVTNVDSPVPPPAQGAVAGSAVLDDLEARGLLQDTTDREALRSRLDEGPITLYCGFDPTADSLHIGHLVPLLLLRRFQQFGHRPIALAGGATGMIGDPSGRSDERNLLDREALDRNVAAIEAQLRRLIDFGDGPGQATLVDNRHWTEPVGVLDFLRDVGKLVTVNTMLAKESVRARVASENGISFTEFSYMLLQANDFRWLHDNMDCELQAGGSDQWGNITAGIDMIRRTSGARAHGLTVPLVTRSDGAKFGKTAAGAIWLDPQRTSPYEFFQYWMNTDDRDTERFLLQMTLLPLDEIVGIVADHQEAPDRRQAQRALAEAVTTLVHGREEAEAAGRASNDFTKSATDRDATELEQLAGEIPTTALSRAALDDLSVVELLVSTELVKSKGEARRQLDQRGIYVNDEQQAGDRAVTAADLLHDRYILLRRGKKSRHLVVVSD
jgi:tyrosyl-tRNA synthetase